MNVTFTIGGGRRCGAGAKGLAAGDFGPRRDPCYGPGGVADRCHSSALALICFAWLIASALAGSDNDCSSSSRTAWSEVTGTRY